MFAHFLCQWCPFTTCIRLFMKGLYGLCFFSHSTPFFYYNRFYFLVIIIVIINIFVASSFPLFLKNSFFTLFVPALWRKRKKKKTCNFALIGGLATMVGIDGLSLPAFYRLKQAWLGAIWRVLAFKFFSFVHMCLRNRFSFSREKNLPLRVCLFVLHPIALKEEGRVSSFVLVFLFWLYVR